jgi:8-oxo-dGTP pyrophosphatase MutT (NUDIX family)
MEGLICLLEISRMYCNNCGKIGHLYHQCKIPITSIGVIAFRVVNSVPEFLMIRRKDTLGLIDFMRGKYSIYNKYYIMNMLNQMTIAEKNRLAQGNFDLLWQSIWGVKSTTTKSSQYQNEECSSRDKYVLLINGITSKINANTYTLNDLVEDSNKITQWQEAEWGFPKGRRNSQENDFDCAIREFCEETGFPANILNNVQNILPYEEIFTGSNYKSYKHKYYLMYINYEDTLDMDKFERAEVSKMEWKTYEDCMNVIRDYNVEKKRLIHNVYQTLLRFPLFFVNK